MEPVDPSDVLGQVRTSAFLCWTMITSSILRLRTPTAKTTSLRSFLSMGLATRCYQLQWVLGRKITSVRLLTSPKELGEYLLKLDKDDELYNEYFQWKGTGEFINTKFWCRVCALLHDPKAARPAEARSYSDINNWWRGDGICSNRGWRPDSFSKTENEAGNS